MAITASGCITEEDVIVEIAKPVLQPKKLYLITKRVFDIVFSFLGLVIMAVPMLIIALTIVLDSPGSPIFKQERLGINGKPFLIYKFRSSADGHPRPDGTRSGKRRIFAETRRKNNL